DEEHPGEPERPRPLADPERRDPLGHGDPAEEQEGGNRRQPVAREEEEGDRREGPAEEEDEGWCEGAEPPPGQEGRHGGQGGRRPEPANSSRGSRSTGESSQA